MFVLCRRHHHRKHAEVSAVAFCAAEHGWDSRRKELKQDIFRENLIRLQKNGYEILVSRGFGSYTERRITILCCMSSHLTCSSPWRLLRIVEKWATSCLVHTWGPSEGQWGWQLGWSPEGARLPFPTTTLPSPGDLPLDAFPMCDATPCIMLSPQWPLLLAPGRESRSALTWLWWQLVCNFHLGLQRITPWSLFIRK